MYLTKECISPALTRLAEFESELETLFSNFNLDLRENTGRRNMLLSQAQEVFFAEAIAARGFSVTCSGKTGEPDIVIECEGKELECKLTSSGKRSWPLQCDYTTLKRKGSLDFLYVLSDSSFKKFAVLLFENLTIEDFHFPAPGSREKSRMRKEKAMKKCHVLHGKVESKNEKHVSNYMSRLLEESIRNQKKTNSLRKRIVKSSTEKKIESIERMLQNESKRFERKKDKISDKIKYWNNSTQQYHITLEPIK